MFNTVSKSLQRIFQFDIDCYLMFKSNMKEVNSDYARFHPSNNEEFEILMIDTIFDDKYDALLKFYCEVKKNSSSMKIESLLKNRFNSGEKCIISFTDNLVVGAAWVCTTSIKNIPDFAQCIKNKDQAFILHDAYVLEKHRGKKLQKYMDAKRKDYVRNERGLFSFTFVGCKNFASIRNQMSISEEFKVIYHCTFQFTKHLKVNFFPKFNSENWQPCKKKENLEA